MTNEDEPTTLDLIEYRDACNCGFVAMGTNALIVSESMKEHRKVTGHDKLNVPPSAHNPPFPGPAKMPVDGTVFHVQEDKP